MLARLSINIDLLTEVELALYDFFRLLTIQLKPLLLLRCEE